MTPERQIVENIRKIVGDRGFDTHLCVVESVNSDKASCTVKRVIDEKIISDVYINSSMLNDEGIVITPAKDSLVLVTRIDHLQSFVSLYSKIDKIHINPKKKDEEIEIVINGGTNDGLVKIKELTDKLKELESKFNNHIHSNAEFSGTMTVGAATNPITGILTVPTTKNTSNEFQSGYSSFENDKIKH